MLDELTPSLLLMVALILYLSQRSAKRFDDLMDRISKLSDGVENARMGILREEIKKTAEVCKHLQKENDSLRVELHKANSVQNAISKILEEAKHDARSNQA